LQERREKLERLGMVSLSVFGLGIVGFFLYSLFYKLMLSQGPLVAALALLAAIVFIGCGLGSVVLFAKAKELKEASGKRLVEPQIESMSKESTVKRLESHEEPAFSIADRTTALLSANKGGDGDGDGV